MFLFDFIKSYFKTGKPFPIFEFNLTYFVPAGIFEEDKAIVLFSSAVYVLINEPSVLSLKNTACLIKLSVVKRVQSKKLSTVNSM